MIPEHCDAVAAAVKAGRPRPGDVVLSIRQPYAWLVAAGYKIVENRSWSTPHRGLVWIHASQTPQADRAKALEWMTTDGGIPKPDARLYQEVTSAVVGVAYLAGVYDAKRPPAFLTGNIHCQANCLWWWFSAAALLDEPVPAAGKLKLWSW